MPTTKLTLETTVKGADKASKQISILGYKIKNIRKYALAASTAILAVGGMLGVKSISAAAEFQSKMSNINTLLGKSNKEMDSFGKEVLNISKRIPVKGSLLSEALYDVVSAGISDTAKSLKVLEESAKLGVAGLGSTKEAVDLMTSAVNAFEISADDANDISDILFKTVKSGKTTISELAIGFGKVAPVAKSMKVSFEELQAATAAVTTTGIKASEVQTGLKAVMSNLIKPAQDLESVLKELGAKTGKELIETSGGLVPALEKVRSKGAEMGFQFGELLTSVEGLTIAESLLGSQNEIFTTTLESMRGKSNEVDAAFKLQTQTFASQWAILKNQLNVAMVKFGTILLPIVTEKVTELTSWIEKNEKQITSLSKYLAEEVPKAIDVAVRAFSSLVDIFKKVIEYGQTVATILKVTLNPVQAFMNTMGIVTPAFQPEAFRQKQELNNLNKLFQQSTPRAANGGTFGAGQPVVVGEEGPELFVTPHAGSVIPNNKSFGNNVNIHINTMIGEESFAEKMGDMIVRQLTGHIAV